VAEGEVARRQAKDQTVGCHRLLILDPGRRPSSVPYELVMNRGAEANDTPPAYLSVRFSLKGSVWNVKFA
jgi:hypothetical protein